MGSNIPLCFFSGCFIFIRIVYVGDLGIDKV